MFQISREAASPLQSRWEGTGANSCLSPVFSALVSGLATLPTQSAPSSLLSCLESVSGGGEDTPVPPGQVRCRAHKAVCRGGGEGADRTGFEPSVARLGSFLGRVSNIPLRETTFPLSIRDFKSCYRQ